MCQCEEFAKEIYWAGMSCRSLSPNSHALHAGLYNYQRFFSGEFIWCIWWQRALIWWNKEEELKDSSFLFFKNFLYCFLDWIFFLYGTLCLIYFWCIITYCTICRIYSFFGLMFFHLQRGFIWRMYFMVGYILHNCTLKMILHYRHIQR